MTQSDTDQRKLAGGNWYALVVLMLIYTCHYIDRSVLSILIEPIKDEFKLTDTQLGVLTGLAFALFYAAAGIPLGLLIDRINRRNLLAVLVLVWSAFTAMCGLAQNFWQLLFARFAVGLAESGGSPAAMSMITDIFPPRRRSMAVGFFWMSTAIGAAIALSLGGLLAQTFGWRTAFFVAGAPGLFLAILLVTTIKEPRRGATEQAGAEAEARPTLGEVWRTASGDPVFVRAFLGTIAASVVGSGIMIWEATFLVRVHGFSLFHAGLTVGAIALTGGAGATFLGGLVADRLAKGRGPGGAALVPASSGVLSAGAGLLMVAAPSAALSILGLALWEMAFRTYYGGANSLILSSVGPRMRGVAAASLQACTNLIGWGLGPAIIGMVSDAMRPVVGEAASLRWGLGSVLVFSVVTALMFFWAARVAPKAQAGGSRAGSEVRLITGERTSDP